MMNKYIKEGNIKMKFNKLLPVIFALGCASADEYESQSEQADAGTGNLSQPLMSGYMGAQQFGFKPSTETTCTASDPNQTCVVPSQKALRFFITGGSSAQRQVVRTKVNAWYQAMVSAGLGQTISDWLFSEASSVNDPYLTLIIDVDTGNGFCTGTGNETNDYSCFSGSTTALVEASGINGNYRRWTAVPVLHIDYDEVQAISGLNNTQKANATHHVIWSGLNRFVGLGLVIVGDNRCTKSTVITFEPCFVTTAQACAANSFGDEGNQTEWRFGGVNCGQ